MVEEISADEVFRDTERQIAQARLAGHLSAGELSLLLGAGVSAGLGMPAWSELVECCERRAAAPQAEPGFDVTERMDAVRRSFGDRYSDYLELVRSCLYSGFLPEVAYPDSLLQNRLLIALGALVMTSSRGSVTDVLTLNFDDVLDWYLDLHGFRTQVIQDLPVLESASVDVRIMHIHGFIPLMNQFERSSWVVLSHDEFVRRLADLAAPWPIAIERLFQSKVLLCVGAGLKDSDLRVLIAQAHDAIGCSRPVGYFLDRDISAGRAHQLRDWGLVPVSFETFEQIPDFLLGVCRRAASGHRTVVRTGQV